MKEHRHGIAKNPLHFPKFAHYQNRRVHIGVCGSISAYKILDLMRRFQECGLIVSVTLTPSAQQFVTALSFESLGASVVYTKMFPDNHDTQSSFPHLEPGQVADAMLIAPASASTLARLATGMADELLACQVLAFDGPILLAPAMNTKMWLNPATEANIDTLLERGYFVTEPDSGLLACQETGTGRLADLRQIYLETLKLLTEQDLYGKKILITLGPTQEKWDAVRVWTNNSTGAMGMSFALAAWLRGAKVYVVAGKVNQFIPHDPNFIFYPIENAQQMFDQCNILWDEMDIGVFTAAVADFSPCKEMPKSLLNNEENEENLALGKERNIKNSSEKKGFLFFKDESTVKDSNSIEQNNRNQNQDTVHTQAHIKESDEDAFTSKKFKKENYKDGFSLLFQPNNDILKHMGARKKTHQKIIGFAAESGSNMAELARTAQQKLFSKNCDILVGNFIDEAMGAEKNCVLIAYHTGKTEQVQSMSKTNLAFDLLTELNRIPMSNKQKIPLHGEYNILDLEDIPKVDDKKNVDDIPKLATSHDKDTSCLPDDILTKNDTAKSATLAFHENDSTMSLSHETSFISKDTDLKAPIERK